MLGTAAAYGINHSPQNKALALVVLPAFFLLGIVARRYVPPVLTAVFWVVLYPPVSPALIAMAVAFTLGVAFVPARR